MAYIDVYIHSLEQHFRISEPPCVMLHVMKEGLMEDKLWIGVFATVVFVAVIGYLLLSGYIFQPTEKFAPTGELREFAISAKRWEFNLTRIEVDIGDTVRLKITGVDDGIGDGHGFAISEFDINEVIKEGLTVTIEFVADKAGTFAFRCSVFCGAGHSDMTGTLVVHAQ